MKAVRIWVPGLIPGLCFSCTYASSGKVLPLIIVHERGCRPHEHIYLVDRQDHPMPIIWKPVADRPYHLSVPQSLCTCHFDRLSTVHDCFEILGTKLRSFTKRFSSAFLFSSRSHCQLLVVVLTRSTNTPPDGWQERSADVSASAVVQTTPRVRRRLTTRPRRQASPPCDVGRAID